MPASETAPATAARANQNRFASLTAACLSKREKSALVELGETSITQAATPVANSVIVARPTRDGTRGAVSASRRCHSIRRINRYFQARAGTRFIACIICRSSDLI